MKKSSTPLNSRPFLYMTEFFSGMSVMAVELGANRILAPYFSSSQIVWTIIIGTIMIAMAIGNIWGGRSADKNPDPVRLYRRILLAAVWIACIPLLGKYVLIGISAALILTINENFLILAALCTSLVLFVFPLMLLGTVTPTLAKLSTSNLDESGRIVGSLGACNTIGSIIGTFLPTFVTIPAVGTSITFLIFSGILMALSLYYLIRSHSLQKRGIAAMIIFLVCCLFGNSDSFAFWENDLIYEGESIYNYLQVKDTDNSRIFSTNVLFGVQSIKMKDDSLTGMFYDYDLAGPAAAIPVNEDGNILMLGNGTGTFASQCKKYFPNASIEAVEIDQKITDLARKYFDYPDDIPTTTYDGRTYLHVSDEKYNVICVDAYQDITIPFQMSSQEFFTEVKKHLKDGGILVVNMNMHGDDPKGINTYLCDTIASVFGTCWTVDVPNSTNRELYAVNGEQDFPSLLVNKIPNIKDAPLNNLMTDIYNNLQPYTGGNYILTDDKAPVELLGIRMIDSLIKNELGYYRDLIKTNGLESLLN